MEKELMHSKAFTIAVFLEKYEPVILEKVINGIHGTPELRESLMQGQRHFQKQRAEQLEKLTRTSDNERDLER